MRYILYSPTLTYEGEAHRNKIIQLFDNLGVKNYSLIKSIDTNKEVFCVFPSTMNPSVAVSKYNLLTDELVGLYHSHNNIKFIFINVVECDLESCCDNLYSAIKSKNIKEEDVILVTENQKIKNLNDYKLNVFPITRTPPQISISMSIINPVSNIKFIDNKEYLFQCFNNISKPHRFGILTYLKHHNILDKTDWSLLNPNDYYKQKNHSKGSMYSVFDKYEFDNYEDDFVSILNHGNAKYSKYENQKIRNPHANGEPDHGITYKENPHKNAYINIVTESQFDLDNTTHITEKTVIPFYFQQLPIFVSTPGFVKTIREKFDFDLFDDLIDHSYDNEKNHYKRLYKISQELKRLSNIEDEVIDFYKKNKKRIIDNQIKVTNLNKKTHLFNLFDIINADKIKVICEDIPITYFSKDNKKFEIWGDYTYNRIDTMTEYLSNGTAKINKISINDEITSKSFFILDISRLNFDLLFEFFNTKNKFCELLNPLFKNPNVNFIFVDLHEISNIEDVNLFVKFLVNSGINNNRLHIINNDSILKDNCIIRNVYKSHQLATTFGKGFLESSIRHVINKNNSKFFLCHNRTPKFHRLLILSFLNNKKIINDVNYSFLGNLNYLELNKYRDLNEFNFLNDDISIINSQIKYSDNENESDADETYHFQYILTPSEYENSYVNITTESNYFEKSVHITEKSFKPLAFYQIPLIIGGYRHNYYLKKEYGFDLFEDIIDLSFDEEPDNVKRMLMIFDEIERLYNNKENIIKFYKENYNRFIKNRKIIRSIVSNYKDLSTFKKIFL